MTVLFKKLEQDGEFTEDDRQANHDLVNASLYPWFYDKAEIPAGLILEQRAALVPTSAILSSNTGQALINSVWQSDGNPKQKEIHQSMEDDGFQLKYPAVALLRMDEGQFDKLNGRTRSKKIIGQYNYGNVIADIYKPDPNYSRGQVLNAAQEFGESANFKGYHPHGKSTVNDMYYATVRAIESGYSNIETNKLGCPIDDTAIEERINRVYGENCLQKKPKESLVRRIMAYFSKKTGDKNAVRYWDSDAVVQDYIKRTYKFVDVKGTKKKRGIVYHVIETSSYRKAIMEITQAAIDNPNCEIRVVIYPAFLSGRKLDENYWSRIKTFVDYWNTSFTQLSLVYWNGTGPFMDRVSIYAAVPSLPYSDEDNPVKITTMDKPIYFIKGIWKQK